MLRALFFRASDRHVICVFLVYDLYASIDQVLLGIAWIMLGPWAGALPRHEQFL